MRRGAEAAEVVEAVAEVEAEEAVAGAAVVEAEVEAERSRR